MSLLKLHVSRCNDLLVTVATLKHVDKVSCKFCICPKHTFILLADTSRLIPGILKYNILVHCGRL